jgi:hypothetical protein
VEVAPRTHRCPKCGITWDRDRCAVARLPVLYLERLEGTYEESDDAKYEVSRLAVKYRGFVKRHAKFLNRSPAGRVTVNAARKPLGLQRAGPRRV